MAKLLEAEIKKEINSRVQNDHVYVFSAHPEWVQENYTVVMQKCTKSALRHLPKDEFIIVDRLLECMLDPQPILHLLQKNFKRGLLRCISPMTESVHRPPPVGELFLGNPETQHIMWVHEHTLHILPKLQCHGVLKIQEQFMKETSDILEKHDLYRDVYHFWDEERPLNFVFHSVDEIVDLNRYSELFIKSITQYVPSMNQFICELVGNEELNGDVPHINKEHDSIPPNSEENKSDVV